MLLKIMSFQWPSVINHIDSDVFRHVEGNLRVLVAYRVMQNLYNDGNWLSRYQPSYFNEKEAVAGPELRVEATRIAALILADDGSREKYVAEIDVERSRG